MFLFYSNNWAFYISNWYNFSAYALIIISSAFLFCSFKRARSSEFFLCWAIMARLDFYFSSSSCFCTAFSWSSCFCFSWSSLSLSSDFIWFIWISSIELLVSGFGKTIVCKLMTSWKSLYLRSISSSSSYRIYCYLRSSCSFISFLILSSLSFSDLILSCSSSFCLCLICSSS
jgi:hypothetical protein